MRYNAPKTVAHQRNRKSICTNDKQIKIAHYCKHCTTAESCLLRTVEEEKGSGIN